jgi:hypothetical protein
LVGCFSNFENRAALVAQKIYAECVELEGTWPRVIVGPLPSGASVFMPRRAAFL